MDGEHFKPYAQVKDTDTTEKDRPSFCVPAPKPKGRKRRSQGFTLPPDASGTPPPDIEDISSSQVEENENQNVSGNFQNSHVVNK